MLPTGAVIILIASLLSALSGVGIYYAHKLDPHFSPLAGILLRILANFSCLFVPWVKGLSRPRLHSWHTARDLWLWGIFGVFTLLSYYYSVVFIGAGMATVLSAGGGVLTVCLAPLLTKQRLVPGHVPSAIGCAIGIFLLAQPSVGQVNNSGGSLLAIASGLFSAIAYIMVARTRNLHQTETVLLHWTVINLIVISIVLTLTSIKWPKDWLVWLVLLAPALLMAWSQYFTAMAYQQSQASLIACLSFIGPLLNILIDSCLFRIALSTTGLAGVFVIIVCGFILPVTLTKRVS